MTDSRVSDFAETVESFRHKVRNATHDPLPKETLKDFEFTVLSANRLVREKKIESSDQQEAGIWLVLVHILHEYGGVTTIDTVTRSCFTSDRGNLLSGLLNLDGMENCSFLELPKMLAATVEVTQTKPKRQRIESSFSVSPSQRIVNIALAYVLTALVVHQKGVEDMDQVRVLGRFLCIQPIPCRNTGMALYFVDRVVRGECTKTSSFQFLDEWLIPKLKNG